MNYSVVLLKLKEKMKVMLRDSCSIFTFLKICPKAEASTPQRQPKWCTFTLQKSEINPDKLLVLIVTLGNLSSIKHEWVRK